MTACRFFCIKNVKAKMQFNFQMPFTTLLPMTSQWRFDKQYFIFLLNYHLIIVFLSNRRLKTGFIF